MTVQGSIVINDYMSVIHRGSVQHLGSQVSGRLCADCPCWDAFEAVFPAATALRCISRMESKPRTTTAANRPAPALGLLATDMADKCPRN